MAKKEAEKNTAAVDTAAEETKSVKSIVPSKYAGKYKGGGSDELAQFINQQCTVENKFSYDKFFELCRTNGVADEHIKPYADAITAKAHGAQGRTRMTLRNRLAAIGRHAGNVLKGLDGESYTLNIPAPVTPVREKAAA